jgi:hypothetical protein
VNLEGEALLSEFNANPGASEEALSAFVGFLPDEYLTFLRRRNGGEGFVGDNYLILWRAEELLELNEGYGATEYAPDLFLFGSNGGGEAFAFDKREQPLPIVMVPFIGMQLDEAIPARKTFSEFLHRLAKDDIFNSQDDS